jgi:hypothetical protein
VLSVPETPDWTLLGIIGQSLTQPNIIRLGVSVSHFVEVFVGLIFSDRIFNPPPLGDFHKNIISEKFRGVFAKFQVPAIFYNY